ncbi:SpoIIIAH-like family protein [Roseburia sp. MSJ-14]|uniref:SpoIIIAH-like family protein n=1 Tax=Roseburia sp. MSJ-14 TaxID=2841514 RepID=UPI001C0F81B6|nr:SpoIIIAH-like family protein [Roseburia sp. MSJ-14]MBU5472997.1 SpoIIIAH-like family protein [Roseburia sp. MSJ-14]
MKNIFRKNQIIITALAMMIAVAGYLQYTGSQSDDKIAKEASADLSDTTYEISDEEFSADNIFTDTEAGEETTAQTEAAAQPQAETQTEEAPLGIQTGEDIAAQNAKEKEAVENPGEAVLTSNTVENVNFAAEVKLNREQMRSQNKATLLEVINNTNISQEQKQNAIDAMVAITDISERENAAEMLLEAKGFTDVVVSITDDNADVVLNMGEVTDAKRAQIEDIVKRKTNVNPENIIITPIQGGTSGTVTQE